MKALCITGLFQHDLDRIEQFLRQAGMQPAIPAQSDSTLVDADMEAWHAQAHAAYEQALNPPAPRRSSRKRGKKRITQELQLDPQGRVIPGTALEQQAGDIFSANQAMYNHAADNHATDSHAPDNGDGCWGWADARSISFLEFWIDFDPTLHFILVCMAPEHVFTRALAAGTVTDPAQLEEQLATWHAQHEALLRFHHRHRERSVLVDTAAVAAQPQAFLQHLNERWPDLALTPEPEIPRHLDTDPRHPGPNLRHPDTDPRHPDTDPRHLDTDPRHPGEGRGPAPEQDAPSTLANWLARQGLEAYAHVRILQQELAATQAWLGGHDEDNDDASEQPAPAELIADYAALQQQASERQGQIEQLARAQGEQAEALQAAELRLKDQLQASEQLQEALLSGAKQAESLQQQLVAMEQARAAVEQERDEHAARYATLQQEHAQLSQQTSAHQVQIEELTKDLAKEAKEKGEQAEALQTTEQRLQDQQHENELLLAQLHQVQEELEAACKQAEATRQQLATQEQACTKAEQERDAYAARYAGLQQEHTQLGQQAGANQTRIEQLTKEQAEQTQALQAVEQRLKDQQHESELLLVQLHQVQEELEATFKQAETTKRQLATLEQARTTLAQERDKQSARYAALQQEHSQLGKHANERQAQLEKLTKEKGEQTKLALERQTQLQQLAQAKQGLEKELADIRANPPQNQAQADALQAAEQRLQDQQQESELLLLQLHQVQEELEAIFIQHETTKQQLDAATKAQANAEQARLKLDQLANERQAQIQTLHQERTAQANQAKARQDQLLQLGKEKEQQTKLAAERQAELSKTREQQAKLTAERDTQRQQLAQANTQREKDNVALQQANAQWRDQQQENELLLLQLHQVQEELEYAFTQGLEQKQQLTQWAQRWQRMLQRNPDYCDFGILEVEACDDNQRCNWLIKDVALAGRSFPALRFQTVLESGCAGIVFTRAADGLQPLLRWAGTPQQLSLTLLPLGTRAQLQERIGLLLNLGTQDWELLNALPPLLLEALAQNAVQKLPAHCDVAALRKGLEALQTRLQAFPTVPRYDQLDLVHEQVNPDYEHLCLRMTNLSLGTESWPSFEFRLSCAHVKPNEFGLFPKLEFPETVGQAPFDSWFVESHDDFGAKCELRFALKAGSLDMQVWQQLSVHDRSYINELAKLLPTWLTTLQHNGVAVQRPWEDWQQMARGVQKIMRAMQRAAEPEPAAVEILEVSRIPGLAEELPEQSKQKASRKTVSRKSASVKTTQTKTRQTKAKSARKAR